MPLVSVIINVRNGVTTLAEAIDSVFSQTLDDWELIIWDDRSNDGSAEIVARYSDERVRFFISDKLVSLGQARRQAIELARGQWIAFLDQDDIWLPGKLELQMEVAHGRNDVALVYGRTVRFYPSGSQRDYDQAHEYELLPEGDIFSELFTHSCFIAMSSAVFRRSAIQAISSIPESVSIIPDYYLYTAIARRYRVAAVQVVVCRYRVHSGNTSRRSALQVQQEALQLMNLWRNDVDPGTLTQCRKRHHTAIALLEMRTPRTLAHGIGKLLSQGSLASQLLRPIYFVFHLVRRTVRPPLWKTLGHNAAETQSVSSSPSEGHPASRNT